jgi:hypothetical protein
VNISLADCCLLAVIAVVDAIVRLREWRLVIVNGWVPVKNDVRPNVGLAGSRLLLRNVGEAVNHELFDALADELPPLVDRKAPVLLRTRVRLKTRLGDILLVDDMRRVLSNGLLEPKRLDTVIRRLLLNRPVAVIGFDFVNT